MHIQLLNPLYVFLNKEKKKELAYITMIPKDVITYIFHLLDFKDRLALQNTCKTLFKCAPYTEYTLVNPRSIKPEKVIKKLSLTEIGRPQNNNFFQLLPDLIYLEITHMSLSKTQLSDIFSLQRLTELKLKTREINDKLDLNLEKSSIKILKINICAFQAISTRLHQIPNLTDLRISLPHMTEFNLKYVEWENMKSLKQLSIKKGYVTNFIDSLNKIPNTIRLKLNVISEKLESNEAKGQFEKLNEIKHIIDRLRLDHFFKLPDKTEGVISIYKEDPIGIIGKQHLQINPFEKYKKLTIIQHTSKTYEFLSKYPSVEKVKIHKPLHIAKFPKLENLRTLKFVGYTGNKETLAKLLLKNPQITKFVHEGMSKTTDIPRKTHLHKVRKTRVTATTVKIIMAS